MTSTLNPACLLRGLRYANKPLVELHVRGDHRSRRQAQPGRVDVGGTRASWLTAGSPSRGMAPTAASAAPRASTDRPRRILRAFRQVNYGLMRASQAVIRQAPAPRCRSRIRASAARGTLPYSGAIMLTRSPEPPAGAFPPVMTASRGIPPTPQPAP